ncbi:MAG: type II toxin-antitoxin system VapB family antitoxin [Thermoleophilia bacterium]
MRTNVVIDDDLMTLALEESGVKTRSAVIEEGLRLLVERGRQSKVKAFRNRLKWTDDLDEMRTDLPSSRRLLVPRRSKTGG